MTLRDLNQNRQKGLLVYSDISAYFIWLNSPKPRLYQDLQDRRVFADGKLWSKFQPHTCIGELIGAIKHSPIYCNYDPTNNL